MNFTKQPPFKKSATSALSDYTSQQRETVAPPSPSFASTRNSSTSSIESRVKAIIVEKLSVSPAEVTMHSSFANDLGADSLEVVELMMDMEREFGISIPETESENLRTVGDVIQYIEQYK